MNDQDRITKVEAEKANLISKLGSETMRVAKLEHQLQAVEKEHTALRLAAEELVTYVRHGDQEDIGEAMGKIESILQPKKQ